MHKPGCPTRRQLIAASAALAGAAGPSGNTYGDPAGHSCLAVDGPVCLERMLRTGHDGRQPNMLAFATAALELLEQALDQALDKAPG